jgi:hypothetical protein
MERRHLRRAADQALMTPAFLRPLDTPAATAHTALRLDTRTDADYADRVGDGPDTNAHEPADAITEPIDVAALHDRLRNAPDDVGTDDVPASTLTADHLASAPIGPWKPDLIERHRFRVVQPWYRTKAAAATLAAVALASIVVSAVTLVSRGAEQSTSVTPEASTTASPPPSSAQPALSRMPPTPSNTRPAAPPPPPPPPPPPTPATTASTPPVWRNNDSWTPSPPPPTKKPEIGVIRTPFSATPPPPPAPGINSATPGDGPKRPHRWGPW